MNLFKLCKAITCWIYYTDLPTTDDMILGELWEISESSHRWSNWAYYQNQKFPSELESGCDCDPINAQTCFKQINVIQNEYNSLTSYITHYAESKKEVSKKFMTALNRPFKAFSSAIKQRFISKKPECKANHKYRWSKCFNCILALIINQNKTMVTAVLIVGNTCFSTMTWEGKCATVNGVHMCFCGW